MKVTLLSCSPRANGNCDTVAEWAGEMGARVLTLREYEVRPCDGCDGCAENGTCRYDDGAASLYDALDASDAIAVVAPVYFRSFDARTKAFFDRAQMYYRRPHSPKKPLFLVGIGGRPDGKNLDGQIAVMESFCYTYGASLNGVLRLQADGRGEIDTEEQKTKFCTAYAEWLQKTEKGV